MWKPESLLALRASRAQFRKKTTVAEHPLCSELKERLALDRLWSSPEAACTVRPFQRPTASTSPTR